MNVEVLYSYVIGSTWCFLVSWVALLLAACVAEFRHDWSPGSRPGRAEVGAVNQRYSGHPVPHGD